jgi:hypothetical protein
MKKLLFISLFITSTLAIAQSSQELYQDLSKNMYDVKAQTSFNMRSYKFNELNTSEQKDHYSAIALGLDAKNSTQLRNYMITALQICGQQKNIPQLAALLNDKEVVAKASTALATLSDLSADNHKQVSRVTIAALPKATAETVIHLIKLCSNLKIQDQKTLALIMKLSAKPKTQQISFEALANCGHEAIAAKLLGSITEKGYLRSRNLKLTLLLAQNISASKGVVLTKKVMQIIKPDEVAFYLQAQSVLLDLGQKQESLLLSDLNKSSIRRAYGAANLLLASQDKSLQKPALLKRFQDSPNAALLYLIYKRFPTSTELSPLIAQSLNSQDSFLQKQALALVSKLPAEQMISPLLKKLFASPKNKTLISTIVSLNISISKNLHDAWKQVPSDASKVDLITIFSERRDTASAIFFFDAIASKDKKLRISAIKELKNVVQDDTNQILDLLKTASRSEQRYLINALASDLKLNDNNISLVQKRLALKQSEASLITALGQCDNSNTLVLLAPYLKNENLDLRSACVKSLGSMTSLDAGKLLLQACQDKESKVAILATRAALTLVVNAPASSKLKIDFLQQLKLKAPASETQKVDDLLQKLSTPSKKKKRR